jgi:hypothetical protein
MTFTPICGPQIVSIFFDRNFFRVAFYLTRHASLFERHSRNERLFALDPVLGHNDMRGKFPLWQLHSIVVLNDRMCVAGNNLRPGDYVFDWREPRGPYEKYPDGCESSSCSWVTTSRMNGTKRSTRHNRTSGRRKPRRASAGSSAHRTLQDRLGRQRRLDQLRPIRGPDGDHLVVEVVSWMVQAGAVAVAHEDKGAGARV